MVRKLWSSVAPPVAAVLSLAAAVTVEQQYDHHLKEKCISSVCGGCVGVYRGKVHPNSP